MSDDYHEFVPSVADPERCGVVINDSNTLCNLPARAGSHLIVEEVDTTEKKLTITIGLGMNINIDGIWTPAELALVSIVVGDMCRTALAQAAAMTQSVSARLGVKDHLKKSGRN